MRTSRYREEVKKGRGEEARGNCGEEGGIVTPG